MKTTHRPELKTPVAGFAAKLRSGPERIPLEEFAALFGAGEDLLARVRARGDLVFKGEIFTNDGPELVVPAGKVELEVPSLLRGTWAAGAGGFTLTFPHADFCVCACVTIAILRKCFDLKEIRATSSELVLDFGGGPADRRYTF